MRLYISLRSKNELCAQAAWVPLAARESSPWCTAFKNLTVLASNEALTIILCLGQDASNRVGMPCAVLKNLGVRRFGWAANRSRGEEPKTWYFHLSRTPRSLLRLSNIRQCRRKLLFV